MKNALIETQDGSHSILSEKFGVSYHSKYGAIQESMHVFIEAGLHYQVLKGKPSISILEFGFGTGLNAYLSSIEALNLKKEITYYGIEAYPLDMQKVRQLNYAEKLNQNPSSFEEIHLFEWETRHQVHPYFTLFKHQGLFEDQTFKAQFDLVYFDAFAPSAQPELWDEKVLGIAYQALKPEGVIVTYCAKGVVKRALKSLGFKIESLPGPPGKREMTRGIK